jgi:hypothetical protein
VGNYLKKIRGNFVVTKSLFGFIRVPLQLKNQGCFRLGGNLLLGIVG